MGERENVALCSLKLIRPIFDQSVGRALTGIGCIHSDSAKKVDLPSKVLKVVPVTNISKKPVPLTAGNYQLVHEPA